MNKFKQNLQLAWKDFQSIIRDRGMLTVIIGMPMLFGLIMSSAYSGNQSSSSSINIPVAILNQDEGRYSSTVLEIMDQIDVLEISKLPASEELDSLNQTLLDGTYTAAVIIPKEFSSNIETYEGSEITLLINPQNKEFGDILQNILNDALAPVIVEGEIRYGIRSVMETGGITEKI